LQRVIALERAGAPFLLYRGGADEQIDLPLDSASRLSIGRDPEMDIGLPWDTSVSRLHAELERRGGTWLVIDDGMSTNGTRVNGEPVRSRRRLLHRDVIVVGATPIQFYAPGAREDASTARVQDVLEVRVTPAQQRVLEALCQPYPADPMRTVTPPTNREIAEAIFISERAVKSHLRALFQAFGIDGLPQNAKRARLVDLAVQHGLVGTQGR
jgi:pSer/pThr/pTyr-binding forkhead associated (FHA) protein